MTVIKNSTKDKVEALLDAGIKPMAISKQLELKYETVKKFAYTMCQGYLQREFFFIERALVFRL
jgi:hypothetical protein